MAFKGFDLTGKVALVTGGNGGIGLAMARAMAEAGANIVIWGTNAEKNDAAEAALSGLGVKLLTAKVDVSQEQQVIDAFGQAVQHMGRVDTVIANAGVGYGAPAFTDITIEGFHKVHAVNVDGALFTLREAARHMITREGGGSLVGIASLAAIEGAGRNQAYGSSKGALVAMIRGIAVEMARYGIRANAILPGWVATDLTGASQASQKFNDNVISRVPIRRWGQPEDYAGIAVYLASDASRFHTGDQIIIDGGYAIF
ncbi:MAG: 2-dehydro-3-deoxy-D-gluconate 5-dehydrogenase [Alphaproteobacteria bacterium]|nr:2-dehydro-3-deoxy-D-gluconate 5-dehydrogenase [Alphaproteobacteria bacterium]